MNAKRQLFFTLRSHWALRIIPVLIAGALVLSFILFTSGFLFDEKLGCPMPTRSYAHLVSRKLILNLGPRLRVPPELLQWRSTGEWDREPVFPKSAFFWFTYNSTDKSYVIQRINLPHATSAETLESWKGKITSLIDSTFAVKQEGLFAVPIPDDSADLYLKGKIYSDEPRVIGMVQDMDKFWHIDIPEVLEDARQTFPGLDAFTADPKDSLGHSLMFILVRDEQDSIVAKIGAPGGYAHVKDLGMIPLGYKLDWPPSDRSGYKLEFVIPNCPEKVLVGYVTWGFRIFAVIWVITLILWVRAEILLRKARS